MEMEENFSGWRNRETWATMLHIDNDEVLHETAMDYAKTALEEHKGDVDALYCLQDTLKAWIEEDLLTLENVAGNQGLWLMLTDIGSLYRIDWREVAESFLENAKEEASANV